MTLKDRMSQAFYRHKGPEAMVAPTTDELQNAEVALDEDQDLEPPATVHPDLSEIHRFDLSFGVRL
ncbi:hypothetical protein BT69DRAFT_1291477 [Atractiella rhizophila]|nr:hypothetical protein BT69DRAFT_1291477 [Atractiella rhizophila]